MSLQKSRFERWLSRRFGLTITCCACGRFTFRDTCQRCRNAIDARYAEMMRKAQLSVELAKHNYLVAIPWYTIDMKNKRGLN